MTNVMQGIGSNDTKIMKRAPYIVFKALMLGIPVKLGKETYVKETITGEIGLVYGGNVFIGSRDVQLTINDIINLAYQIPPIEIVGLAATVVMKEESKPR
jgi:hypothetical protein